MTFDKAATVAQECADTSGITQAISHDKTGAFFVFTCPTEIDEQIDAVIEPSYVVSTNHI